VDPDAIPPASGAVSGRRQLGAWVSGALPAREGYPGARLDLPARGPGSLAGTGRRLGGLFADWFAALAVTRLVGGRGLVYGSPAFSLVTLAVFFAEISVLVWLTQASFGHRLLRMRVVRVDGGRVGLPRAAARAALVCLVVPMVVRDRDGRGLHDRWTATAVVATR